MSEPTQTRKIITEFWRATLKGKQVAPDWLDRMFFELYGLDYSAPDVDTLLPCFRVNIPFFSVYALGVVPWVKMGTLESDDQLTILEAIPKSDAIAVRSGHKVSKSNSAAIIALWACGCFADARVPMTSSSFFQVKAILWREIKKLHRGARIPLGGTVYDDPQSGYKLESGNEIFGFSTNEPERAAGISGSNITYIIDEASGVDSGSKTVFDAIDGNLAGGARIILFSNPTRTVGKFYDCFHKERADWVTIRISSRATPNVYSGKRIIPGLATKEWVNSRLKRHGRRSPFYNVRVLGEFPPQGPQTVIPLHLIESARERYDEVEAIGVLSFGVDVGRYGDDESVIYPVRGQKALEPIVMASKDGNEVAARLYYEARQLRRGGDAVIRILVDEIGVGSAVIDSLNHEANAGTIAELGIVVIPVNVTHVARDEETYHRRRDELTFSLRDWLAGGGAVPDDPFLEEEMAGVEYEFDAKGRYQIPPNKKEREMFGRSPDRRKALELAISDGSSYTIEYEATHSRSTYSRTIGGFRKAY